MLTKEEILAANDRPLVVFNVPEWGGDINLRKLTTEEAQQWRVSNLDDKWAIDRVKARRNHLLLASLTIADDKGGRLFTMDELADKSAAAIERIAAESRRINGLDPDAIEEAEKN